MMEAAQQLPWTLIAAFIAAAASLAGVTLNIWALHSRAHRDSLAAIANHRVRWIEALREATAALSAELVSVDLVKASAEQVQSLQHRANRVVFMTNDLTLVGDDSPLLKIAECIGSKKNLPDGVLASFATSVHEILKKEWEKAKRELKGKENDK